MAWQSRYFRRGSPHRISQPARRSRRAVLDPDRWRIAWISAGYRDKCSKPCTEDAYATEWYAFIEEYFLIPWDVNEPSSTFQQMGDPQRDSFRGIFDSRYRHLHWINFSASERGCRVCSR